MPPNTAVAVGVDLERDTDDEGMDEMDYEAERQANIRNNAMLLDSLGLKGAIPATRISRSADGKPHLSSEEQRIRREAKIRTAELKQSLQPTRRSGRVAAIQQKPIELKDEEDSSSSSLKHRRTVYSDIPQQRAPIILSGPEYENDGPMESQPQPTRGKDGTLIFEGRWRDVFKPNLTPEEMFGGGAFGGCFFRNHHSKVTKTQLSAAKDVASLPFTLPANVVRTHLTRSVPDSSINRFKVTAGQSLDEWEAKGWIWSGDPRGWAEWYTRFWAGRRCEDNERQIRRWMKVTGPTGRFKNQLIKKIAGSGGKAALGDEDVGRVVRQCLWQWGYELNESEWDKVMKG